MSTEKRTFHLGTRHGAPTWCGLLTAPFNGPFKPTDPDWGAGLTEDIDCTQCLLNFIEDRASDITRAIKQLCALHGTAIGPRC